MAKIDKSDNQWRLCDRTVSPRFTMLSPPAALATCRL